MQEIISVIVPIYNVAPYLVRCVESIINQTYKNIEIILINDGSTDNSLNICEKYRNIDERIFLVDKVNGGLSDARNAGLDVCKGEYVAFVDSDDYVEESYLEKLYEAIKKADSDIAICSFSLVNENGKLRETEKMPDCTCVDGRYILSNVLSKTGYKYVVAWNKLYKREIFENLRFPVGKYYEDEYVNYRIFYGRKKIALVSDSLYNYVLRSGSITMSSITPEKIDMKIEMYRERIRFYKDKNDMELYYKAIQQCCNWFVSCSADVKKIMGKDVYLEFQTEMRNNVSLLQKAKVQFGKEIAIQNVLGYINLDFARCIKTIYKRG